MPEIDWAAVERLVRPLYPDDPLHDWAWACRMARQVDYLKNGIEPFDALRARLLCWFSGVDDRAADPAQRRGWMRPLRAAGVSLEMQTWLWIALERYRDAPATNEERVAHDARSLERVGAAGAARAFTLGGQTGRPMAESVADLKKTLGEVVFLTPAGRRLGVRRVVYARRFLKELEEE